MKYHEYKSWAEATINRSPCRADWEGLTVAQASGRATALVQAAEEDRALRVDAFHHLKKFVETLTEKYPRR